MKKNCFSFSASIALLQNIRENSYASDQISVSLAFSQLHPDCLIQPHDEAIHRAAASFVRHLEQTAIIVYQAINHPAAAEELNKPGFSNGCCHCGFDKKAWTVSKCREFSQSHITKLFASRYDNVIFSRFTQHFTQIFLYIKQINLPTQF